MMKMMRNTRTRNNWVALARAFTTILLLGAITFVIYEFRPWWKGPSIDILSPQSGQVFDSPLITLSGTTDYVAQLYINGVLVPTSLDSNSFSYQSVLAPGINTLAIDGYGRYGRHIRTIIPVVYKEPKRTDNRIIDILNQLDPAQEKFVPDSVFKPNE